MAVTANYKPPKYNYTPIKNSAPAGTQASTANQQLRGVSSQTQAQKNKYSNAYKPSQSVTDAQNQLRNVMNSKPAGYQSKWGGALDNVLQQIQNPKEFKYSFNDDEMFKYYADLYTQKGRQASQDVMGQAAGMTGGYGNSYASAAGNQAYQQYLLNLYDRGMDLYDRAYQRYADQRADQYNQLGALRDADNTDYGRYRDTVADWQGDRDYYTGRADVAYERDYDAYLRDRDYWNQQAQLENQDWWTAMQHNEQMRQNDAARQLQIDTANADNRYRYDTLAEDQNQFAANYAEQQRQYDTSMAENQRQFNANYDQQLREFAENQRQFNANFGENQRQFNAQLNENIRQFNETSKYDWAKLEQDQKQFDANLTEEQRQYNRNMAYSYVQAILGMGNIPSNELLVAAGLSRADAQKMIAQAVAETTGGGGGSGGNSGNGGNDKKDTGNTNPEPEKKPINQVVNDTLEKAKAAVNDAVQTAKSASIIPSSSSKNKPISVGVKNVVNDINDILAKVRKAGISYTTKTGTKK